MAFRFRPFLLWSLLHLCWLLSPSDNTKVIVKKEYAGGCIRQYQGLIASVNNYTSLDTQLFSTSTLVRFHQREIITFLMALRPVCCFMAERIYTPGGKASTANFI